MLAQDGESGSSIQISNNVRLNFNVMINADNGGKISIGDNVLIGPNVILRASNHNFKSLSEPIIIQGHVAGKIIIEENVWIGANVVILPNVTIGKGSVIAAGSVVNNDVPQSTIFGGVPAKFLKERK